MTPEQKQQRIAEIEARQPERVDWQYGKDIDFLLSLVKSQEAGCSLCGGPHDFDTSIPSVVWNSVIRERELPEYLCAACIVREFVRVGQGFTATLWNEEFNGVPIELVVNGQNAKDATLIQEENNSLRNQINDASQSIVNEAGKVAELMNATAISMRSACIEKVKAMRDERIRDLHASREANRKGDAEYERAVLFVLGGVITALESLSIQEQEK